MSKTYAPILALSFGLAIAILALTPQSARAQYLDPRAGQALAI